MTEINIANLKETLKDIVQEILTESSLAISPKKTSILLWTNKNPKYPNSFILQIGTQKILGLTRTDRNGETYWKFREHQPKEETLSNNEETNNSESSPVMDNIAKFQQRQAQAQPHESTISHESQPSESVSN